MYKIYPLNMFLQIWLKEIKCAQKMSLFILTGAGISAPSGLCTFRDDKDGFWKRYDSDIVSHARTRKTKEHYQFTNMYRKLVSECEPNAAHRWIANLQRKFGDKVQLYTTNVDDLHEMAGSKVIHLHGCVNSIRCDSCDYKTSVGLSYKLNNNDELCHKGCSLHGRMRNDVVLFDEELPESYSTLLKDLQSSPENSIFLVIGTSLGIYSWDLVRIRGTKIFVNTDAEICKHFDPCFHEVICGDISKKEVIETVEKLLKL